MTKLNLNSDKSSFDKNNKKIEKETGTETEITKKTEPELTEEKIQIAKETAYERRIYGCSTIDEAITEFLDMCKDGKNFFVEICGIKLYSVDTKTEDDAYMQIFGKTKIEQEKVREEYDKQRELEKKKNRLEAIEKIPGQIEEGKKYIDEEMWEDWEDYVNSSARDMFYGKDVDDTLKILKLIEEGESWQKIQEIFDENCDDIFYYGAVRKRVIEFTKKGKEARQNLKKKL